MSTDTYDHGAKLTALRTWVEVGKQAGPEVVEADEPQTPTSQSYFDRAAAKHDATAQVVPAPPVSAGPVQLPIWPEPQRAQLNTLLCTAVFGITRARRLRDHEQIAAWGDLEIRLTGISLTQYDETIWMQLVHLWKRQNSPQDFIVRFKAKPFLREIGWGRNPGGSGVLKLRASLARLCSTYLELEKLSERELEALQDEEEINLYGGSLILEVHGAVGSGDGHFAVTLNPKFIQLFQAGYTRIDWETRLRLPEGLATWLHRYALRHQSSPHHPHRVSIKKLWETTGSIGSIKEFRRKLKRAIVALHRENVAEFSFTRNGALQIVRNKPSTQLLKSI